MFCKYINCLCSTRFLLTVNILCSSILEVIKIYIYITSLTLVSSVSAKHLKKVTVDGCDQWVIGRTIKNMYLLAEDSTNTSRH